MLGGQGLVLDDASTLAAIEERLTSPHQAEVLYALDLLERAGAARLGAHLITLLGHSDPLIRREAAGRIARLGLMEAAPALRERLGIEDDPGVLGAVIGALATIGHGNPVALAAIRGVLADTRPELQIEASVGLLRAPGSPAVPEATALLTALAASPAPEERVLAARALGDSTRRSRGSRSPRW